MANFPQNSNGQATMANSSPIVIASDQSTLNVSPYDAEMGNNASLTSLRDIVVAERYTVWGDSLADGISSQWTQTAASGGTITSTVGEGQLKTSTATTGSIVMVSPTTPYLPGQVAWFNSAVRFNDTGTAGNIRRVGMFTVSGTTPQEGFYFELNSTTLNAVYVKAGSATSVAVGSWSEFATSPFTLDTNYHGLEIRFTANSIWFYVDNRLRHKVSGTTTPLTTTLSLPITLQNTKTSGATDITLAVRNTGNGGFGKPYEGDWLPYHLVSAATTNATVIKASTGRIGGWYIYNSNVAARKVAFHNTASTPTAGSSVYWSAVIPPSSGANCPFPNGIFFPNGIAITTTTGLADNDTAAVALNDLNINIFYK